MKQSKRTMKDGSVFDYLTCRKCNTERLKKYRNTPEGRKKTNEAIYRSIKANKHKQKARELMNYHLNAGHINKPNVCVKCKEKKKLEGHHEDYSRPLDVIWVCRQCHYTYFN